MKFAIIFLFLPCLSFAQGIPKKANEIRVGKVSFRQVVNTLLDSGYILDKIDSNYNIVSTEPKRYSRKTGGMVQFNIRVKDSIAIITGYCGVTEGDFNKSGSRFTDAIFGKYEISNYGMKKSVAREAWDTMVTLAKSFGNQIEYIKKE